MNTTAITARTVRSLLLSQPALASEISSTIKAEGIAAGLRLLSLRLGCGTCAAVAGWARYRDSSSRVVGCAYISRNGGQVREYTSLVGGGSISMCAAWPMTRRVSDWIAAQEGEVERAVPHAAVVAGLI